MKEYTFDNIDETVEFAEEVQMCCCEIAEHLYKQDNKDHEDNVQSEKKGEWSTSYVTGKEAMDINESKILEIVYNWLAITGLLYRGCF